MPAATSSASRKAMATKPMIGKTKAAATRSIVTMRASRFSDTGRRPAGVRTVVSGVAVATAISGSPR